MKKYSVRGILAGLTASAVMICPFAQAQAVYAYDDAAVIQSGECGENLTWTLDSEGTLTISGTGDMDDFEYDMDMAWYGQPVNQPWYSYVDSIRNVVIKSGVTSIGNLAFWGCENISTISIPDTVSDTGSNVYKIDVEPLYSFVTADEIIVDEANPYFRSENGVLYSRDMTEIVWYPSGKNLTGFAVCDTVKSIGEGAFANCTKLKEIVIPESVVTIGDFAFNNCAGLTELTIPEGVVSIGRNAFDYCGYIKEFTIPDSVTSIGERAFQYCGEMEKIRLSENIKSIEEHTFHCCQSLSEIKVPESVETIGKCAFNLCLGLEKAELSDGLKEIGDYAFYSCGSLADITIPGSVSSVGFRAFEDCGSLETMTILSTDCKIRGDKFTVPDETLMRVFEGSGAKLYATDYRKNYEVITEEDITKPVESKFAKGDVDMDGVLTGHDAAIVSQYADGVLKLTLSDEQLYLADMNGDGEITQDDAAAIAEKQEYGLGVIDTVNRPVNTVTGEAFNVCSLSDSSKCMRMFSLRVIDPKIVFGSNEKRADIDCNGIVDLRDFYLCLYIVNATGAGNTLFEDGKYYISEPDDKKIFGYEYMDWYGVNGSDCSSWEDFCEKVSESYIKKMLDTDGDSSVTVSDASVVLKEYSKNAAGVYSAEADSRLDINEDGVVNIEDATLVLRGYAKSAAGLI